MNHKNHGLVYAIILVVVNSLLSTSCNSKKSKKNVVAPVVSQSDSLRFKLTGVWGNLEYKDKPVLRISFDSIYYFSTSVSYPYKIDHGDMIIDRGEWKAILANISVIADTLFFFDPNAPDIPIRADRLRNTR